ncbi:MAG: NAD(P)H-dependent oxidoreductase [Chthoniobacteraceae bacterium]|nr:NAD(P)H-dependent oxidoreductase [Chthoniobacteraceae bacterium]
MGNPRILAFAGSLRSGSFNKKLVRLAARAARAAGAEVTEIDLLDFQLPLLNQDDEDAHGLPENAKKLKALFLSHQGLLLSAPEYNSSLSAVLKNTLDWVSRAETPDETPLAAFTGKTAALMSASPGALGGLRGLVHLRAILGNIGVWTVPAQVCIPKAHEAFTPDGALKDPHPQAALEDLARKLVETTPKLA